MFYVYVDVDLQDACMSLYLYTHFVCKHIYKYYIHMFSIWDICSKWPLAKKQRFLDPDDGPPESGLTLGISNYAQPVCHSYTLDIRSCFLRFVVFWVCYQVQIPNTCMHTFFIYIVYIVLCNVDTLAFGLNPSSILGAFTLAAFEEKFIPTKHRMTWHSSQIWRWMEQSLGHWQKDRIFLVAQTLR